MSLTIRPDRRHIRTAHRSNRFLLVDLVAPPAPRRTERAPVNLAFVVDRSGSMSGAKIATARTAVEEAIGRLAPDDRFAVVVYDDQIDVVAESSAATPAHRRAATDALRRIDARGSTNLAEGWLRGCEQVALHLSERGVNRALLLTDGLANIGITDAPELQAHATELRRRGVATSTFGVGADFDERLLQALADAGGGHFYFIESAAQIRDHMTSEVGESLEVVARDVAVRIDAPEGVTIEALSPYRTELRPGAAGTWTTTISIGDLVSEQQIRLVIRAGFPFGTAGAESRLTVTVTDRDGALGQDRVDVPFTWADDRTNDLQPRDRDVDRAVAQTFSARVRLEALELNRTGRFSDAAARLAAVASRIRTYAGADAELQRIATDLDVDMPVMSAPMAPMQAKAAFFASANMERTRTPQGRAQRRA